jgi:C1A family cysteine protease
MRRTPLALAALTLLTAACGSLPTTRSIVSASTTHGVVADGLGHSRRLGYNFPHHRKLKAPQFGALQVTESSLPSVVDLRTTGQISPVYDQGDLGACTAFSLGKGLRETLLRMEGQSVQSLSALYLYYKEREAEGTVNEDAGSTITTGIQVLKAHGECLDATMPYRPESFKDKPNEAAEREAAGYEIGDYTPLNGLAELKAQLATGRPAVFGFTVYHSFMGEAIAKTGMMPMPRPKEKEEGGHAVLVVGYDDDRQVLIIKNSWGTGWGDKGYFYMPYAFVTPDRVDEMFVAR